MYPTCYTGEEMDALHSRLVDDGKLRAAIKVANSHVGCWTSTETLLRIQVRDLVAEIRRMRTGANE